jgi:hypothetical protein
VRCFNATGITDVERLLVKKLVRGGRGDGAPNPDGRKACEARGRAAVMAQSGPCPLVPDKDPRDCPDFNAQPRQFWSFVPRRVVQGCLAYQHCGLPAHATISRTLVIVRQLEHGAGCRSVVAARCALQVVVTRYDLIIPLRPAGLCSIERVEAAPPGA